MDISSGFKKVKKYIKTSIGYKLLSHWTSSHTVEMDDGTTLEERIKNVDNTADKDKPISTAQQTALDKKADLVSPTLTGTPMAPTASAGTNTAQIATTAFVQTAVSDGIAASDALIFKGTIGTNGTVSELPTAYKTGWTYRVVTSGTYAGQVCETGDLIIALADRAGSNNMDSDWCVAQTNIDGAITGVKSGDAYIDYSQSRSIVTITHKDVARTDTASTASPNAGDAITVVKSVTSDEKGHVTGVDTETVTLPSTSVTVDSELSSSSTNPVQNKVLYNKISNIDNTADADKNVASAEKATKDGNGNVITDTYMTQANPVGTGSFSMNRKADTVIGDCSHAEGNATTAIGNYSHAEGSNTIASHFSSHAEGNATTASGLYSHAEGSSAKAIGKSSHAEGAATTASGLYSHAEGSSAKAIGKSSHAEGAATTASGDYSHAEGSNTTASGDYSHAEGYSTTANGLYSHAEGYSTTASGERSHTEGTGTKASGIYSHAEGYDTTASNYASHACGKLNKEMTTGGNYNNTTGHAFVIGNGTSTSARSNAFSVMYTGVVKAASTITASTTADYAEFFEWKDGNPNDEDRVGKFVTLDGNKIVYATEGNYILGIVSGEPFVLGNGDCDTWNGMYLRDEFGRTIYEPAPKMEEITDSETDEVTLREVIDGDGNTVYEGTRPVLNPAYDHEQPYISRFDRKEWSPVGMLGVLSVYDDGTCTVNGYCKCNKDGIATACERDTDTYRVIERLADNIIRVAFK